MNWTRPYCGLTYLQGHRLLDCPERTYQVTVTEHDSGATADILALRGEHPFTPIWETRAASVDAAKAEAEAQFRVIAGDPKR